MNFTEAWAYLCDLQMHKIKLGLEAMEAFLARVGNPQRRLAVVHVGGTNGKGSTSATLAALLQEAGYRVGLYTSPHLVTVLERFQINNRRMEPATFARLCSRIHDVLAGDQITYFECTTAIALLWFAEQEVDLAILEVGMGGRLDATNVVTPLLTIITNVSMDHEAYLGDTLAQVAGEKAGIIKAGCPVISGVADDVTREVIEQHCADADAPLFLLGRDFSLVSSGDGQGASFHCIEELPCFSVADGDDRQPVLSGLTLGLAGLYQRQNVALALAAAQFLDAAGYGCSEKAVRRGVARARWPGRLELIRFDQQHPLPSTLCRQNGQVLPSTVRQVLLDGAHNPAGIKALTHCLDNGYPRRRLIVIWGAMADKDIAFGLQEMISRADLMILTRPEGERSAKPEEMLALLPSAARDNVVRQPTVRGALCLALEEAHREDLILVVGSLYLVGAARGLLLGETP